MNELERLPNLRQQTRENLQQAGIYTLEQFAALSIEELQRIKGIKSTAAGLKANAIAYVEQRPVWFNEPPDELLAGGWMLDLETSALAGGDGMPWCIGWGNSHKNMHVVVIARYQDERMLALNDGNEVIVVEDEECAWEKVFETVKTDNLPIYAWTGFDAGVLNTTAPEWIKEKLAPRMRDLHRIFVNTVRLPQKSYSIKPVAEYFGFHWSGYQEWWRAETDYRHWLETDDIRAITHACAYQRDDVLALIDVWNWMINNQP